MLLAAVLTLAACGDDEEAEPTTTTETSAQPDPASGVLDPDFEFPELAYIEPRIGAVPADIRPDGRAGTPPPDVEEPNLEAAADAAGCELRLDLPDEGNQHLSDPDVPSVEYRTNPPTSGDHYAGNEQGAGALADGAYLDPPAVGRIVHALEHGRVAIQYSPELTEAEQLEIKGVFEDSPGGMLLFPNPDMPYAVAATAWTHLVGCDEYSGAATLDVLRGFRDEYLGRGPEDFPIDL